MTLKTQYPKAMIDSKISHEEFKTTVNEKKKYDKNERRNLNDEKQ